MAEEAKIPFQATGSLRDQLHEEHYRLTLESISSEDVKDVPRSNQFAAGTLDGTINGLISLPGPMGNYLRKQFEPYHLAMIVNKEVTWQDIKDPAVIALVLAYTQVLMNAFVSETTFGRDIARLFDETK